MIEDIKMIARRYYNLKSGWNDSIGGFEVEEFKEPRIFQFNYGPGINPYDDIKHEEYKKYIFDIQWSYNSNIVTKMAPKSILAYPSPKMDLMISIFPVDSKKYSYPNSLMVFNPDGSILYEVEPPTFISKESSRVNMRGKKGKFGSIGWIENDEFDIKIGIVSQEVEEYRKFNPYTGEFGDNIGPISLETYTK
ncbi:hypothetical protein SB49_06510 [Sediminicola sp. YIK13]|uniref:hypothetical protein n=1 Tax=Sediminicola sp. YIK13 TaxID=1453352 RepID=UPI00071F8E57|nr:hypothetical protein [Sediminicola sp. YIK13]ALM07491.1 hypothetical protein SB49_06510 [Sediminicola sp. YIK13]